MNPNVNIYLVGLMGAGKTTVGRQLAKRMERRFVDSDHELETRTGVRIPVVFDIEGEAGFRKREAQVLADLCSESNLVMATGGGAVLAMENRRRLKESGVVVYLAAPPGVLFERTRQDRNRPLLQVGDPLAKLEQLHAQRDPIYREVADIVIEGKDGGVASLVNEIERQLKARCQS